MAAAGGAGPFLLTLLASPLSPAALAAADRPPPADHARRPTARHLSTLDEAQGKPLPFRPHRASRPRADDALSLRRAAHRVLAASHRNATPCAAGPSAESVCRACAAAGGGRCAARFAWDWRAPLRQNEAGTSLPGLPAVRGVDALGARGVAVVARWNQSNWPGLLPHAPVHAASAHSKAKLCGLWRGEHAYQSWPVLLGCPGFEPQEYEPPCANVGAIVEVRCAMVDLAAGREVFGDVYDDSRWFRASHWMHPPEPCRSRKALHIPRIASALSVYPFAVGHFVPEQLPALLVLNAILPPNIPILVYDAPVVRRHLLPLQEVGVLPPKRIMFHNPDVTGPVTIHADAVYMPLNSHFSNVMSGDKSMSIARAAFDSVGQGIFSRRHVLIVDRGNSARHLTNADAVKSTITDALAMATSPQSRQLQLLQWRPSSNVSRDVAAFRHAALIVAPHGAGLSNILFATEGTPVIEICYDSFQGQKREMFCPAMYAAMAVNLNLPYWVVTAHGSYTSGLRADIPQLRNAIDQALLLVEDPPRPRPRPMCGAVR
ncbi:hypothetical protein AB1Y20_011694 [Prymnesium parvum]|uniref:Glycosyltransferase 61 catalytic domain-containing protein n=1 Tax=Prymnesium parvum TaxID=97485 RepID=A0AB34IJ47_PRYPA